MIKLRLKDLSPPLSPPPLSFPSSLSCLSYYPSLQEYFPQMLTFELVCSISIFLTGKYFVLFFFFFRKIFPCSITLEFTENLSAWDYLIEFFS